MNHDTIETILTATTDALGERVDIERRLALLLDHPEVSEETIRRAVSRAAGRVRAAVNVPDETMMAWAECPPWDAEMTHHVRQLCRAATDRIAARARAARDAAPEPERAMVWEREYAPARAYGILSGAASAHYGLITCEYRPALMAAGRALGQEEFARQIHDLTVTD